MEALLHPRVTAGNGSPSSCPPRAQCVYSGGCFALFLPFHRVRWGGAAHLQTRGLGRDTRLGLKWEGPTPIPGAGRGPPQFREPAASQWAQTTRDISQSNVHDRNEWLSLVQASEAISVFTFQKSHLGLAFKVLCHTAACSRHRARLVHAPCVSAAVFHPHSQSHGVCLQISQPSCVAG